MTTLTIRKRIIVVTLFLVVFFIFGCSAEKVPDAGTIPRDTSAPSDSASSRPTTTPPAGEVKGANVTHVCLKVKPLVEELYSQSFQIPELMDPYANEASCRIVNGFPGRGLGSGQVQILINIKKDSKSSLTGEGCASMPSWDEVKNLRTKPPYFSPEIPGASLSQTTNYFYQEKAGFTSKLTFQTSDQCVYSVELHTDSASSASSLDNLGQLAPAIVSAVIENANSR